MTLTFQDCSDGELATLSIADRSHAFPVLMRRYEGQVYRVVRGLVGNTDEALDLVQETFVAAYLALGRYDPARPFGPWLARIALNKCRDWGRRRAVRRLFAFATPLDGSALDVAADTVATDDALHDRQILARVGRAIPLLPVKLKEPLILCGVEGLSQAEAAVALGITEKAVETRIRRARAALAESLSRV